MTAFVACVAMDLDENGRPLMHVVDYYMDTEDEMWCREYAVEYAKALFYRMYRVQAEFFLTKVVHGKCQIL